MLNNMKKIIHAPIIQLSAKVGILGMATVAAFNYVPKIETKGSPLAHFNKALHTISATMLPSSPVYMQRKAPTLNIHIPLSEHFRKSSAFGPRHRKGQNSKYKRHDGVDIAANIGTPITAPAYSEVAYKGRAGKYGNTVILYHGNDVYSLYAHLKNGSINKLKIGDHLKEGEAFAKVGTTGRSSGPHLHTEIIIADSTGKHGHVVDPQSVWNGTDLSDPDERARLITEAKEAMGQRMGTRSAVYTARITRKEYSPNDFNNLLKTKETTYLASAWKSNHEMSETSTSMPSTKIQAAFLSFNP